MKGYFHFLRIVSCHAKGNLMVGEIMTTGIVTSIMEN